MKMKKVESEGEKGVGRGGSEKKPRGTEWLCRKEGRKEGRKKGRKEERKSCGTRKHRYTARPLNNLAVVYKVQDPVRRSDAAREPLHEQALLIIRKKDKA